MSKELVISSNRHETRVALLEDDQLVEVYFQRANEYSLAGSIHKGRVTRVLPGMQSAFVDLGLERDTFLYVSDFLEEEHEDIDRVTGDEQPPASRDVTGIATGIAIVTARPPAMRAPREPAAAVSAPRSFSARRRRGSGLRDGARGSHAIRHVGSTRGESGKARWRPGPDRGEDRDRRGRRSRRRRNRGRGFPESKYAEVGPAAAPAPTPVETEPADAAGTEPRSSPASRRNPA